MDEVKTAALILLSVFLLAALYYAVGFVKPRQIKLSEIESASGEFVRACGKANKVFVNGSRAYFSFCDFGECAGVYVSASLASEMAERYFDVYSLEKGDFVCVKGVVDGRIFSPVGANAIEVR